MKEQRSASVDAVSDHAHAALVSRIMTEEDASADREHESPKAASTSRSPMTPLQRQYSNGSVSTQPDGVESDSDDPVKSSSKKASGFQLDGKKIVSSVMICLIVLIIWDSLFKPPEQRFIQPDSSEKFLRWVEAHPAKGLFAIVLGIAIAVVFMVPIGTPLTLGCGYIYKGAYGWKLGLAIATAVSMGGSALGAVTCFLLGRYLMREQVRKWIKKYPLFDAIDAAAAEHGLRIMAMLYLTPILPLGPVSYMCGTTSMELSSFVIAKIASLPLMLLYVFIGASTGALLGPKKAGQVVIANIPSDADETVDGDQQQENVVKIESIEGNPKLIVSGILLSAIMISLITHYIRKELNKVRSDSLICPTLQPGLVSREHLPGEAECCQCLACPHCSCSCSWKILDRQKKHKPGELERSVKSPEDEDATLEMGITKPAQRHRRGAGAK